MGYKDAEKQSAYQVEWQRKRRQAWIEEQGGLCTKCGSSDDLRVVSADVSKYPTKVFSFSRELRNKYLKKCSILCRACMIDRQSKIMRAMHAGKKGDARTLSPALIWAIRGRLMGRESEREIAEYYRITHRTISDIRKGKIWGWLKGGPRRVYGIERSTEMLSRGRNDDQRLDEKS